MRDSTKLALGACLSLVGWLLVSFAMGYTIASGDVAFTALMVSNWLLLSVSLGAHYFRPS